MLTTIIARVSQGGRHHAIKFAGAANRSNGRDLRLGQRAGIDAQFINVAAERLGGFAPAPIADGHARTESRIEVAEGTPSGEASHRKSFDRMGNNIGHPLAINVQPELVGARGRTIRKQDAALEDGGKTIRFTRSFRLHSRLFDDDDYPAIRKFFGNVATADQEQVVLKTLARNR